MESVCADEGVAVNGKEAAAAASNANATVNDNATHEDDDDVPPSLQQETLMEVCLSAVALSSFVQLSSGFFAEEA